MYFYPLLILSYCSTSILSFYDSDPTDINMLIFTQLNRLHEWCGINPMQKSDYMNNHLQRWGFRSSGLKGGIQLLLVTMQVYK